MHVHMQIKNFRLFNSYFKIWLMLLVLRNSITIRYKYCDIYIKKKYLMVMQSKCSVNQVKIITFPFIIFTRFSAFFFCILLPVAKLSSSAYNLQKILKIFPISSLSCFRLTSALYRTNGIVFWFKTNEWYPTVILFVKLILKIRFQLSKG